MGKCIESGSDASPPDDGAAIALRCEPTDKAWKREVASAPVRARYGDGGKEPKGTNHQGQRGEFSRTNRPKT
jgi:hypothetical protein